MVELLVISCDGAVARGAELIDRQASALREAYARWCELNGCAIVERAG